MRIINLSLSQFPLINHKALDKGRYKDIKISFPSSPTLSFHKKKKIYTHKPYTVHFYKGDNTFERLYAEEHAGVGSGGERERHAEDQYCPSKRTRCNHRCGYFPVIAFATSITRALLLSQMDAGNAFVPVRSLASQSIDSVHLKVVNPIPRITVHIYAMINLPPLIISYVHVFCNSTIA